MMIIGGDEALRALRATLFDDSTVASELQHAADQIARGTALSEVEPSASTLSRVRFDQKPNFLKAFQSALGALALEQGTDLGGLLSRVMDGQLEYAVEKQSGSKLAASRVGSLKPLRQRISYEDFVQQIMADVAQIPDFKDLWQWRSDAPEERSQVYLIGGRLRGLLKWRVEHLDEPGAIPDTDTLALQDCDKDVLILGADLRTSFEGAFTDEGGTIEGSAGDWDIVDDYTYRSATEFGGASIEAIAINPDSISDPHGGLRTFWEGNLTFVEPTRHYSAPEEGWTGTKQALRFLRHCADFPELTADTASLQRLRDIGGDEELILGRTSRAKYWIEKQLAKHWNACGRNTQEQLLVLRNAGLLKSIARGGFDLPDPAMAELTFDGLAASLLSAGFSPAEMLNVRRVLPLTPEGEVEFTAACLKHDRGENAVAYLELDHFADSGPTARLLAAYFEANPTLVPASAGAEVALKKLGSPVFYKKAELVTDVPREASSNFNMEETVSNAALEQRQRLRLQMKSAVEAELSALSRDERDELAIYMLRVYTGDLSDLVHYKVVAPVFSRDIAAALLPLLPLGEKGQLAVLTNEKLGEEAFGLLCGNGKLAPGAVSCLRETYREQIREALEEGHISSNQVRIFDLMLPEFSDAERTQLQNRLNEKLSADSKERSGLDGYLRATRNLPMPANAVKAVCDGVLERQIRGGGANEFLVGQNAQAEIERLHAHYSAQLASRNLTGNLAGLWMHLLRTADQPDLWSEAKKGFAEYIDRGRLDSDLDPQVLRQWFYEDPRQTKLILTATEYLNCLSVAQRDPGLRDQLDKQGIAEPSKGDIALMRRTLASELATDSPSVHLVNRLILQMPGIRDSKTLRGLEEWLSRQPEDGDNWMSVSEITQTSILLENHLSSTQTGES